MQKDKMLKRNLMYTLLLSAAMMLAIYAALGIMPFGDNTVLTGDLNGLYVPHYAGFHDALTSGGGLTFNLEKSLGGNMLGLFASPFSSPFFLLYLFFSPEKYGVVTTVILACKIILACLSMCVFVTKRFPTLCAHAITMSLCYGFMAYNLAYAQNEMWLDIVILLPLIALCIERILDNKSFVLFSLCLTAAIIFNYYIAFMVCIFCALYFVCGAIVRSLSAREFFSRGLHFLAGALCAGASSAALLVPTLFIVNETKGSIFSLDFSLSANFNLAELFSRMFVGNFRWDDIQSGLPNIYCGMICVVFAVMFFFTRKIKLREKLAYGSLLMILTMSFWIDGLNLIWHGFKAPMWFPYRYSFIFSFVVIILASKALERFELTRFSAGATGLFLVGIFAAVCLFRGPALSVKRIAFAFICCAAAALLVCFAYRLKNKNLRLCAQALCAVAVASELVINSVFIMGTFEKYTNSDYESFVSNGRATVSALEKADTSVFRMENTNFRTLNDPLLLGYNGTSFFCSTQDSRVTRVMNRLGYVNYGESNTYAYGSTAAADSLLSVKYLMSDGTGRPIPAHYVLKKADTPLQVYENPYALPFAFTAPLPTASAFDKSNTFEQQNVWYSNLLGRKAELFTPCEYKKTSSSDGGLVFDLTAAKGGYYYAVFTQKVRSGCSLQVNGSPVGEYFASDFSGVANLGRYKPGDSISAKLSSSGTSGVAIESEFIYCLDEVEFLRAIEELRARAADNLSVVGSTITASADSEGGNEILWLCVPFEDSWSALVNGSKTEIIEYDNTFIGIPLERGYNEIKLHYSPAGVAVGIAISLASALCLCTFVCIEHKSHKNKTI